MKIIEARDEKMANRWVAKGQILVVILDYVLLGFLVVWFSYVTKDVVLKND